MLRDESTDGQDIVADRMEGWDWGMENYSSGDEELKGEKIAVRIVSGEDKEREGGKGYIQMEQW